MNRFKPLLPLLTLCFALCMAAPCIAAATKGEAFFREVEIERDHITLGDIFLDVGDKAAVTVATAPAPGQKIAYDVTALNHIARTHHVDWTHQSTYDRVVITRASQSITAAMIKELVAAELRKQPTYKNIDVILDNQGLKVFRAKGDALNYHLTDINYDPIKNRFETHLVVEKTGSTDAEIIKVTGRGEMTVDVAILNRSIPAGETLSEYDIEWKRVAAHKAGTQAITHITQLAHSESRRDLSAGSVLRTNDLRSARLVTKGTVVTITIETPLMTLSAQGRAMSDGAMGDTIPVLNTQSNRTIDAIVVSTGKVSVRPQGIAAQHAAR